MIFIELLNEKVGKRITNLEYFHSIEDDDYFVMEIGNTDKLYIYGFLRISLCSKLLLTSWDKHYTKKYKKMKNVIFFSKNSFKISLLSATIVNVKSCLNYPIKEIILSEVGDLHIRLENELCIDILVHSLFRDYVYYEYSTLYNGKYILTFQDEDLKLRYEHRSD